MPIVLLCCCASGIDVLESRQHGHAGLALAWSRAGVLSMTAPLRPWRGRGLSILACQQQIHYGMTEALAVAVLAALDSCRTGMHSVLPCRRPWCVGFAAAASCWVCLGVTACQCAWRTSLIPWPHPVPPQTQPQPHCLSSSLSPFWTSSGSTTNGCLPRLKGALPRVRVDAIGVYRWIPIIV